MTDTSPNSGTPKPASSRGLRLALAISVGLNLLVVGVVGGAMLRADGPRGTGMPRDLGFGVFTEALTPENRADLRQSLRRASPDFGQERRAMMADLTSILAALRAEPFDPATLEEAMQNQVERLRARLEIGQVLLVEFLTSLPDADRLAFADRLETTVMRHGPKDGGPNHRGPSPD